MDPRYPRQGAWFKSLKKGGHNAEEARKAAEEKRRRDKKYRDGMELRQAHQQIEGIKKREANADIEKRIKKELELKRLKEEKEALEEKRRRESEVNGVLEGYGKAETDAIVRSEKRVQEAIEKFKKSFKIAGADPIAREKEDFSQLAIQPSSNFKQAGSGSRLASKPHKARGITEVVNRNTISKDSTQSNELCALDLRDRATISKDLTQGNGLFKSEIQNRGATSKARIENDKARITGAIPPNASPGLYAVHQPIPAQQQHLQQQFNMNNPSAQMAAITQQQLLQQQQRQATFARQFQNMGTTSANGTPIDM